MDDLLDPSLTIKVIAHQWYWTIETPDLQFDMYPNPATDVITVNPNDTLLKVEKIFSMNNFQKNE